MDCTEDIIEKGLTHHNLQIRSMAQKILDDRCKLSLWKEYVCMLPGEINTLEATLKTESDEIKRSALSKEIHRKEEQYAKADHRLKIFRNMESEVMKAIVNYKGPPEVSVLDPVILKGLDNPFSWVRTMTEEIIECRNKKPIWDECIRQFRDKSKQFKGDPYKSADLVQLQTLYSEAVAGLKRLGECEQRVRKEVYVVDDAVGGACVHPKPRIRSMGQNITTLREKLPSWKKFLKEYPELLSKIRLSDIPEIKKKNELEQLRIKEQEAKNGIDELRFAERVLITELTPSQT